MKALTVCVSLSAIVFFFGCYKMVPVNRENNKWWVKDQIWVQASGYENWIKVETVREDSVHGKLMTSFLGPEIQDIVVPLDSVSVVKKKKIDPVLTILEVTLFSGIALTLVYIISLSKSTID